MAYLKIKWRKDISKNQGMSAKNYEKYLLKERGTETLVNCHNCIVGNAIKQFEYTQALNGKNRSRRGQNVNLAFEVIHSFCPQESQLLSAEKVNFMGTELAKRYFPDHEFVVITHTDTNKTHNHILVNPVNEKTGKRDITDKKKHLYNLRAISNDISRENGLSIIRETQKERNRNIPQRVREIQRRGGSSYRLDLFQKADFARSYATNFDEYVGILNEVSIEVAITEKTISYYYRGHEKGIRGKRLGSHYDKPGLIEKFKSNDELFEKQPQLRKKIRDGISDFQDGKRGSLKTPTPQPPFPGNTQKPEKKDHSLYAKSCHHSGRIYHPSNHRDSNIIPISEIKKASNSDILDYCKTHNIACKTNGKGETVLKGREHVVISGNKWTNTKNKTTGSLIEFVSFHDETTYLGAIAKITDNKNLLLLEEYFGEVKRPYKSFYIPKIEKEDPKIAKSKIRQFLKHHRINESLADDLFKQKRVQVDKKGGIWFYSDENQKEAIQYTLDPDESNKTEKQSKYKAHYYGKNNTLPFFESYKNENRLRVYTDFLDFLRVGGKKALNRKSRGVLVLTGLNERAFHIFLSTRPNIKRIEFIKPKNKEQQINEKDFIERQKNKLKSFNISVEPLSMEKAIEKERGFSLGF